MKTIVAFTMVLCAMLLSLRTSAQTVVAFPDAEGGGKFAKGGRGGSVYKVTSLEDDGSEGTLRWAIEQQGARIIVFAIGGYIELTKPLTVSIGEVTIAGQTAPGFGICLKNYGMRILADDVIMRFVRIRPGDSSGLPENALTIQNCKNVIIDHCSFSWSNNLVVSVSGVQNVTVQRCIISESLYHSNHPKGDHGFGIKFGGYNASLLNNVIACHRSCSPRLQGNRNEGDNDMVDVKNNIIYNWGVKCIYGGEKGSYNIVANSFVSGSATYPHAQMGFLEVSSPESKFYLANNVMNKNRLVLDDNKQGVLVKQGEEENIDIENMIESSPFNTTDVIELSAQTLKTFLLSEVGANMKRDAVDDRIILNVQKGTTSGGGVYGKGTGIIDSPSDVGGYPLLFSSNPIVDEDNDGMADSWEVTYNLEVGVNDASDMFGSDYTNIEVYINEMVK